MPSDYIQPSSAPREMTDGQGRTLRYAGVNWPAHMEVMVPEGLQYQSVEDIVMKIKTMNMNVVRLTWATEMVDYMIENGHDAQLVDCFINALGPENGTRLFSQVVRKNPSLVNATRFEVFDKVISHCKEHGIYVHLDNHVSKASWCCSPIDGNSYWGDHYFNAKKWVRGLAYMADYAKKWPNIISMSLRNEIRPAILSPILAPNADPTTWLSWYDNMKQGAVAVHTHNPNLLVFLSGQRGDTDLSKVVNGDRLDPSSQSFDFHDFDGFADKLVLELHNYDNIDLPQILGGIRPGRYDCVQLRKELLDAGFSTLSASATNRFPLVLTEFGWSQDDFNTTFATCLLDFIREQQVNWMIWQIGGSYYVRQGIQDADDSWGLLTHDWSTFRSSEFIDAHLVPLVEWTLSLNATAMTKTMPQGHNDSWMFRAKPTTLQFSSLNLCIAVFAAALCIFILKRSRLRLSQYFTRLFTH